MTEGHQQSSAATEGAVNELAAWLIALEDAEMYKPVWPSLVEHGRQYIHAALTEQHDGDCTKKPFTCVVCSGSDAVARAKQILASLLPFVTGAPAQSVGMREAAQALIDLFIWEPSEESGEIEPHLDRQVPHLNDALTGLRDALASQPSPAATVDLTNHHNALKCPYCNPRGLQFAEPHEGCSADTARPAAAVRAAVIEECALICEANPLNAAALAAVKIRSLISEADRHDQDGQTCPTCGRVGNGEG